jgi:hypothetical protein
MEVIKSETKELGIMQQGASLFLDVARFEHAQRVAKMLATSTMVPTQFQGDRGIANCVIALNLAERMRVDPFMLMQNMYIVHGKPGIEAKLAIALMNGNGRFEPLEFEFQGDGETRQCRVFAKEIKSGKTLYGTWVTWKMAKAERWVDKDGSKWKTMPDLMFTYRAAMFFARVYDPGSLLGLRTKDELEDMVIDVTPDKRTLKVDTDTGEIQGDIYATKEPEPVTPPTSKAEAEESVPCPHCDFVSKSERGLKKHITQTHPLQSEAAKKHFGTDSDDIKIAGETLPSDDDPPPFEPDPEPETTPQDKPKSQQANEIMDAIGNGSNRLYGDILKKLGISTWQTATDEQKDQVIAALNAELDAKNQG